MASNRPHYLLRMLRGLQKVAGLNPSMVTVFIDGFWKEPASVTRLMGIKLQQHAGVSSKNARIAQVNHARVKAKRSAVVLMNNLWRINPKTNFVPRIPVFAPEQGSRETASHEKQKFPSSNIHTTLKALKKLFRFLCCWYLSLTVCIGRWF